jgi:hypothetical protein
MEGAAVVREAFPDLEDHFLGLERAHDDSPPGRGEAHG